MPRRSLPKPPPIPSAVWVLTTSTYEQYIGRYAVCMAAVLWLAAETFGFRVRGLSPAQNLLANFGWYLMLAAPAKAVFPPPCSAKAKPEKKAPTRPNIS